MTINKIDKTVFKFKMLQEGDTVCVGVSGGADSMLLLSYLMTRKEALNLQIICANVEHGIRGEESKLDTDFVRAFCRENEIPFECLEIDAPFEAKQSGMGVEEYSRQKRYEFFESLGADKIATAHNLSDNVETVLFRMARGTGTHGLCGIPPVRGKIIRPLIECTSEEIRAFCDGEGIPYVVDRTNFDTQYTRNFIRHEIVPKFLEINPSFEQAVNRMIQSVSEDADVVDAMTDIYERQHEIGYSVPVLRIEKLQQAPTPVVKRMIMRLAQQHGIALDEKHLNEVHELVYRSGRYQIKGNLYAESNPVLLKLITVTNPEELAPQFYLHCRVMPLEEYQQFRKMYDEKYEFFCDYDKLQGEVTARKRQEGDSISPAGRGCTKSLKKLYNECQILPDERFKVPVLCDEGGVIGVVGYAIDERVKLDSNTKTVYAVHISMEDFEE